MVARLEYGLPGDEDGSSSPRRCYPILLSFLQLQIRKERKVITAQLQHRRRRHRRRGQQPWQSQ